LSFGGGCVVYLCATIKSKDMNILSGTMSQNANDSFDTSTIFGEIKRTIISKDFKGGSVKNVFGSTELDFTQADISGTAFVDISQAFGQVTIVIPSNWQIEADITHFASQLEDNRSYLTRKQKSDKVLVLKGLSFFAAVEIVNDMED
jgi:predicted membrane protein